MKETQRICSSCTLANAAICCCCEGKENLLCQECYTVHYQKFQFIAHLALPMSMYGQHNIPGYFERLQARYVHIPKIKEELIKSVEGINKCIAEIYAETEKVVTTLQEFSNAAIIELQLMKAEFEREINEASAELEHTVFEDSPALQTELARQVRSAAGNIGRVKHFSYFVDSSSLLDGIRSLCHYSLSNFVDNSLILPGIIGKSLRLYDIQRSTTTTCELDVLFSPGCKLTFILKSVLLAVGSSPASDKAFLIKTDNAKVSETRVMAHRRRLPGLIAVDDFAYVFGGDCVQSEKYQISTYSWTILPDISTKSDIGITPCLYEDVIYLPESSCKIGVFHIATQCYRVISFKSTELTNYPIAVMYEGKLFAFGNSFMSRWKPERSFVRDIGLGYPSHSIPPDSVIVQGQPVLVKDQVYYVTWKSGQLMSFNLESLTFHSP